MTVFNFTQDEYAKYVVGNKIVGIFIVSIDHKYHIYLMILNNNYRTVQSVPYDTITLI